MKDKFVYHANNHIFIFKSIVLTTDFPDFSKRQTIVNSFQLNSENPKMQN